MTAPADTGELVDLAKSLSVIDREIRALRALREQRDQP